MYDIRNVLKQQPAKIRSAILAVLGLLVLASVIDVSKEAVVAAGIAIDYVLDLFYVAPLTTSNAALADLAAAEQDGADKALSKGK